MRLDHAARLERLLRRDPSVVYAEHEAGRGCLYRRDEVLVSAQDMAVVDDHVRRWVARTDFFDELGVGRLRLRSAARVDLGEFVSSLAGARTHRQLEVGPNHLLRGEPNYGGGPFDTPVPEAPLPPPAPVSPVARKVSVAVLDTGITAHAWFSHAPWFHACDADNREVLDADLDFELDSEAGHGTFIAGVLLQRAPGAVLDIERVLGSDGVCDELDLIRGLHAVRARAARHGRPLDLVNLSLGGYTFDDRPSPLLMAALGRLGRRTVVVAAAGNNGSDRPFWPAALKNCLAVGSLDVSGATRAVFSNYGWWVDACAIGERVASSFVSFDEHGGHPSDAHYAGYARWSGTSFAAPKVTGAIAALAADKDLSVTDAADSILDFDGNRTMPDLGVMLADEILAVPPVTSPI